VRRARRCAARFQSSHPDFEKTIADDRGLVAVDLGSDSKPVYAPAGGTVTVSGKASFDSVYRDVAGINMHFEQPLPLTQNPPGTYIFDNQAFFRSTARGFPETFSAQLSLHDRDPRTFVYRGGRVVLVHRRRLMSGYS